MLQSRKKQFYGIALLVEFRIKLEWPPSFRMFPGSLVDRDITLEPSFSATLTNLP